MSNQTVTGGVVHQLPTDLEEALLAKKSVLEKWEGLTPLARNEWICWVISYKKPETRKDHIERVTTELLEGKRRPCCWIGCVHRKDKPLSPSIRGILEKKAKDK